MSWRSPTLELAYCHLPRLAHQLSQFNMYFTNVIDHMNLSERVFRLSRVPLVGGFFYAVLKVLGVEFPRGVHAGKGISMPHGAVGLVVHESTCIGERATLFQGVTLGRADQYNKGDKSGGGICIGDDVVICAGAKVLFKTGETLSIGDGAIIGANAVLLNSVGNREIWAGVPARLVRRLD